MLTRSYWGTSNAITRMTERVLEGPGLESPLISPKEARFQNAAAFDSTGQGQT